MFPVIPSFNSIIPSYSEEWLRIHNFPDGRKDGQMEGCKDEQTEGEKNGCTNRIPQKRIPPPFAGYNSYVKSRTRFMTF
ncbi:hypothetical protein DPMN_189111 [Dreissena polymorpha]|uniref:Uncharacterized protein n=1 Tax=Dreissena polymorpha TaxID=45954 RepID=A0A9D4DSJ9_DREPO|nr:hypothetical protein DPMN_189111 [Dreissena polymorpha]